MTEERNQNWKAENITKYAQTEAVKLQILHDITSDTEIGLLSERLIKTEAELATKKQPYFDRVLECEQLQTGIKAELVDAWGATEEKTFECDAGTATLRTTKSLNIRSKEKLVEFLAILGKLPEFIKTFETAKLRKIKDAGLLEDEVATWDEKKSIAIKIAEADQ